MEKLQNHDEWVSSASTTMKPIEPTTVLKQKLLSAPTNEKKTRQTHVVVRYSCSHWRKSKLQKFRQNNCENAENESQYFDSDISTTKHFDTYHEQSGGAE